MGTGAWSVADQKLTPTYNACQAPHPFPGHVWRCTFVYVGATNSFTLYRELVDHSDLWYEDKGYWTFNDGTSIDHGS